MPVMPSPAVMPAFAGVFLPALARPTTKPAIQPRLVFLRRRVPGAPKSLPHRRLRLAPVAVAAGGDDGAGGGSGPLDLDAPEERRRRDVGRLLRLFGRLASPYLRRERAAKVDSALVLLSTLANNGISVWISFISKDFWSALNTKNAALFYHQALLFFGVLCVCVPVITYGQYVREMAALRWRAWMTETVMGEYLRNRAFYEIDQEGSLDNPDQRLSADISAFTSESLSFILTVLTSAIDIVSFSAILWSIEPRLFVVLIAYAGTGTLATVFVGKRFVALNRRQLVREADLRYGLVRLRENAESIAFFKGEGRENRDLSRRLSLAIENAKDLIGWQRNLGYLQSTYRYLVQVLPALVVAPRYFSGAVELGTVTQSFGSFSHVFSDFSLVVNRFDALSQLGAQIGRIQELCDAVEVKVAREDRIFFGNNSGNIDTLEKLAKSEIAIREIPDGGLALDNVSVSTPSLENQRELVRDITLRIEPGGRLLIAGVSGCGKSSLVRAIAGLWKNGTGVITRPAGGIFFLPQRPFMTLGSLAQNLVYPKSIEDPDAASDEDLRRILDIVDLHDLPARMGGLKTICDWGDTLSLGEQQRLSFARLLLAKPQLAIIDEGSSALDLAGEQRMYERLRELNITCVSIGHRPSLLKYHDTILRLGIKSSVEDVNSWSIETITEAVREQVVVQAL